MADAAKRSSPKAKAKTENTVQEEAVQILTGQCHCGSVEYKADGPILMPRAPT
jgi:hypothetical protein